MSKLVDDLAKHAVGKTRTIIRDVTGLVDKPEDQMGVAILMACACIGYAAGFVVVAAKAKGEHVEKEAAFKAILEMIKGDVNAAEAAE